MQTILFSKDHQQDIRRLIRQEIDAGLERYCPTDLPQWVKSWQVMKMLGISRPTLMKLRQTGILPYKRVGRLMFYDLQKVRDMMKEEK